MKNSTINQNEFVCALKNPDKHKDKLTRIFYILADVILNKNPWLFEDLELFDKEDYLQEGALFAISKVADYMKVADERPPMRWFWTVILNRFRDKHRKHFARKKVAKIEKIEDFSLVPVPEKEKNIKETYREEEIKSLISSLALKRFGSKASFLDWYVNTFDTSYSRSTLQKFFTKSYNRKKLLSEITSNLGFRLGYRLELDISRKAAYEAKKKIERAV